MPNLGECKLSTAIRYFSADRIVTRPSKAVDRMSQTQTFHICFQKKIEISFFHHTALKETLYVKAKISLVLANPIALLYTHTCNNQASKIIPWSYTYRSRATFFNNSGTPDRTNRPGSQELMCIFLSSSHYQRTYAQHRIMKTFRFHGLSIELWVTFIAHRALWNIELLFIDACAT